MLAIRCYDHFTSFILRRVTPTASANAAPRVPPLRDLCAIYDEWKREREREREREKGDVRRENGRREKGERETARVGRYSHASRYGDSRNVDLALFLRRPGPVWAGNTHAALFGPGHA